MATAPKKDEIVVEQVTTDSQAVCIVGTTPLICNRLSMKTRMELLAPRGKRTSADKRSTLKHDPLREYRDSPYRMSSHDAPTVIAMPPTAFKQSMMSAARDLPGVTSTAIGRNVKVPFDVIPVYGTPKLLMSVTRSSDMAHTPDIRSRAILPSWACVLHMSWSVPILRLTSVMNLLHAAGVQSGVGDWRQEKGSGSFGSFRITSPTDPEFIEITKTMGRTSQLAGLNEPQCFDQETEELYGWFVQEIARRGFETVGDEIDGGEFPSDEEMEQTIAQVTGRKSAAKATAAKATKGNGSARTVR